MSKYISGKWFVGGLVSGLIAYHTVLWMGEYVVIDQDSLKQKEKRLVELQSENLELTEELFGPRRKNESHPHGSVMPYDEQADARLLVASARAEALNSAKFLMVTFGANWCLDCQNLHRQLNSEEVKAFAGDLFEFVNVDVGKFNKNADFAAELGVSLKRGIPVAVFFDPEGKVIGTTNEGQLEPARRYSSKQILRFIRDIIEQSRILSPDAVRKSGEN